MSDTASGKSLSEEVIELGYESDPEDLEGLVEKIKREYLDTLDLDKLLAEHLVLRWQVEDFYKSQVDDRDNALRREETDYVEEKIARLKAALQKAREDTKKHLKFGPEDSGGPTKKIDPQHSNAYNIDKLLAEHLVLRREIEDFYTCQMMKYGSGADTGKETDIVEEKIARWRVALREARKVNEKHLKDISLLNRWKTLAKMQKSAREPALSAASIEGSNRSPAEACDTESEPHTGLTGSTASRHPGEETISVGASSGQTQPAS